MPLESVALPITKIRFVGIPDSKEAVVMFIETMDGKNQSYILTAKQLNWLSEELVTVANQLHPPTKQ